MNPVLRIRLTGRAQRFLHVLQDFGHIDDTRMNELLMRVAEVSGTEEEAPVDLPMVRRVAAIVLFGRGNVEAIDEIEKGVLSEDWPLMFS